MNNHNNNKIIQPEGNFYDKYNSRNPIEKAMMQFFFKNCEKLLRLTEINASDLILEAGCGEGHFTEFLSCVFPLNHIDAFDIGKEVIDNAVLNNNNPLISFDTGNIYCISAEDNRYCLVACSEVVEHLERPQEVIRELERVSSKYVFITVPNEPLWRFLNICRGKYLKDLGNTPGHIGHYSRRKLHRLITLNSSLKVKAYKKSLPWQLILLEKTDEDA